MTVTTRVGEATPAVHHGEITCRACGNPQPASYRFCRTCGAKCGTSVEPPSRFVDPLVGAVVAGRFRILARIGSGGMGAVYRVEHVQIGKVAAMKLLHGELSRDPDMVRRFNQEARAVSRLTSANTVSVFDYGRSDGLVYLVMELLTGHDLGVELRRVGKMNAERVSTIVRQVSASLSEAHGLGIVHRDLKPGNIFLVDDPTQQADRVKVLDFGLAKLAENRDDSFFGEQTEAGVVMGTPYYMSPEQIRDQPIDTRSDIYSLGALVYRLLTGEPLYRHTTALGVLNMHLTEPIPSLAQHDPRLAALDPVLSRALAKAPADRYDDVIAFSRAFSRAANHAATSAAVPMLVPPTKIERIDQQRLGTKEEFEVFERRLRLQRGLSVVMALVLLVMCAAGIYLAGTRQGGGAKAEREPNNDLASATFVGSGGVVTGTLVPDNTAQDVDAYRFDNPTPGAYVIVQARPAATADLGVEIVTADGNLLVRADSAGAGGVEVLPNVPVDEDTVYVLVRGGAPLTGDNAYQLNVAFRPPFIDEESEPNDRTPQSLGSPSTGDGGYLRVGSVGWAGDVDRFELPFSASGGTYDIAVSGVPGLDLVLEVSDRHGTHVARFDESGVGEGESVTYDIEDERFVGAAFVAVRAANAQANSHLVYRLRVRPPGRTE